MLKLRNREIATPETLFKLSLNMKQNISLTFFAIIGFIFRVINVDKPFDPVFDEGYYIRNTLDLIKHGVEFNATAKSYWLVVHPPFGKWMLAPGIMIFGDNSFGWRIAAVFWGSLSIVIIGLIAKELFNNLLITSFTAFFMAFDGVAFLSSRTGILEAPLVFNSLLATLFFIKALKNQKFLPLFGLFMGFALAVKWNALYQLVALVFFYILYTLPRTYTLLKLRKFKRLLTLKLRFINSFFLIPLLVYILSWTGWFITKVGQYRDWGSTHPSKYPFIPDVVRSFWHYHVDMLKFHEKLTIPHPSSAHAYQWLLGYKPTVFYKSGGARCSNQKFHGMYELCGSVIIQLHNPVILYGSLLSILTIFTILLVKIVRKKFSYKIISRSQDLALSLLVILVLFSYLPWFAYYKRTTFNYYVDVFMPYLIILLSFVIYKITSLMKKEKTRKYFIYLIFLLTFGFFAYYYPLYTDHFASYHYINSRLWLIDNFKI